MKIKNVKYVVASIIAALLVSVSWSMIGFSQAKIETADLSFKGNANKEVFVLGEPITVGFEIFNKGETAVEVHKGGVETGFLKVFIAEQDGEYKQYNGYGWGRILGRMSDLLPKQSQKYKEIEILYQGKIEVSHLNERAAKDKLKGKITTEYAFPEPGVYFIKGLSYFGKNGTPIESEPVKVVVKEPVGEDLEVWNQIKGNAEIALLLQNDGFNTGKDTEKESLINQVEQIIEKYPNSIYSGYLKLNLEEYKAKEVKRNEFYKNIKQAQKPE